MKVVYSKFNFYKAKKLYDVIVPEQLFFMINSAGGYNIQKIIGQYNKKAENILEFIQTEIICNEIQHKPIAMFLKLQPHMGLLIEMEMAYHLYIMISTGFVRITSDLHAILKALKIELRDDSYEICDTYYVAEDDEFDFKMNIPSKDFQNKQLYRLEYPDKRTVTMEELDRESKRLSTLCQEDQVGRYYINFDLRQSISRINIYDLLDFINKIGIIPLITLIQKYNRKVGNSLLVTYFDLYYCFFFLFTLKQQYFADLDERSRLLINQRMAHFITKVINEDLFRIPTELYLLFNAHNVKLDNLSYEIQDDYLYQTQEHFILTLDMNQLKINAKCLPNFNSEDLNRINVLNSLRRFIGFDKESIIDIIFEKKE